MYENREQYLESLKSKLLANENRKPVELTPEWAKKAPDQAGVYVLYDNFKLRYAGETKNLRKRLHNLRSVSGHAAAKSIMEELWPGSKIKLKYKSDDKNKLINDTRKHMVDNFQIAYMPVDLGRKELEEWIIAGIPLDERLNIEGKSSH